MLCLNLAGAGGFEPPTTGFGVLRPPSCSIPSRILLEQRVRQIMACLYLQTRLVPPDPLEYVGNLVGNFHSWVRYGDTYLSLLSFFNNQLI